MQYTGNIAALLPTARASLLLYSHQLLGIAAYGEQPAKSFFLLQVTVASTGEVVIRRKQ
jgi:hypothetical protein